MNESMGNSVKSGLKKVGTTLLKEVAPAYDLTLQASRNVLAIARETTLAGLKQMPIPGSTDLKILGKTAGLLVLNLGLSYFSSHIVHPMQPEAQTAANVVYTITGLINGGVGAFTAKNAADFYNNMRALQQNSKK